MGGFRDEQVRIANPTFANAVRCGIPVIVPDMLAYGPLRVRGSHAKA
jgi:hypothetical protein